MWAVTILTAVLAYGSTHPWFGAALALAVLGPAAHAVRYPGMWLESACVTIAICGMLLVAQWGGVPQDPAAVVGRVVMTGLVGFALFMLGCASQGFVYDLGPQLAVSWRVRGKSRLPGAALLTEMHLGNDPQWTVTPTDEDGLYTLTCAVEIASAEFDDDGEAGIETAEQAMFMKVVTDTDTAFEYITFEDAEGPVTANRYEVQPDGEGCKIFLSERATMSLSMCIGFWLTDHMGDYLTSRIDAAEGRPARSIRGEVYNMLIVDIARLFPQGHSEGDTCDK